MMGKSLKHWWQYFETDCHLLTSIKWVHSSIYFLSAFPESSINKFLLHFMTSSYIEDTTCCRSMMEKFSHALKKTFITMDGCTVILCTVILYSLVFSIVLHLFWCWVKSLAVLKFLLHVGHRYTWCLVESFFLWSSLLFGCWFVD